MRMLDSFGTNTFKQEELTESEWCILVVMVLLVGENLLFSISWRQSIFNARPSVNQ